MKRDYETGIDTNTIFLEVTVGTPATATTIVFLTLPGLDPEVIAESGNSNGNIPETPIGKAGKIRNGFLRIETTVDLGTLPESTWPAATEKLVVTYVLNGGTSGRDEFTFDPDDRKISNNGKIIAIGKPIKLT
ncbi:MAG: hypothetical protein NTW10_00290 [Bacteroidetes bacterium]|nr:hypothetical protein [Bacteroidota bacterium]